MKPGITISSVLIACSFLFATEGISIDFLFSIRQEKVPVYIADTSRETPFVVWMNFNGDTILNKDVIGRLRQVTPERIDLVYTDFRRTSTFNQPELNRKRLETLMQAAPNLFIYETTDWRFYGQTKAITAENAEELFHGFLVYPVKVTTEKVTRFEMSFLDMALDSAISYAGEYDSACVVMHTRTRTRLEPTGKYLPKKYWLQHKTKLSDEKTKRFPYSQKVKVQTVLTRYDTVRCYKKEFTDTRIYNVVSDSSVLKALERNKHWKNKLVVADVTGSMSPYTAQLAVWFKLRENLSDVNQFLFFNDGDNTPNEKKIIGKTGGFYACDAENGFDQMYATLKKAMSRGNGGDVAENDVEALLHGIKTCPDCDEVILIADNFAPVKDIRLLHEISRPVRIVLCGAEHGIINSDYLEIARKTGGSIHTMEFDITNLIHLNEGEKIVLGKREYVISRGKFVVVRAL